MLFMFLFYKYLLIWSIKRTWFNTIIQIRKELPDEVVIVLINEKSKGSSKIEQNIYKVCFENKTLFVVVRNVFIVKPFFNYGL